MDPELERKRNQPSKMPEDWEPLVPAYSFPSGEWGDGRVLRATDPLRGPP